MMLPQRIFLVVWWLDELGGMEEHVTELALALRRASVDVVLFSEMPLAPANVYGRRLKAGGIRVLAPAGRRRWMGLLGRGPLGPLRRIGRRLLAAADQYTGGDPVLSGISAGPLGRGLIASLERERRRGEPGVVHVHGIRLGQAWVLHWAALRGIPCAYTEHVTISDWGGPFEKDAPRMVAGSGAAVATIAERSRSSLRSLLPPAAEVAITRHIVRGPERWAARALAGSGVLRVCAVARLQKHKGIDVLLRAVAAAGTESLRIDLRIAGDGPLDADLRRLAGELGIAGSVEFLGRVDHDRVRALLESSDVAALPSLTEGLPLSIVEALGHGLPVIASDVGGIPELVLHQENGLLVPAGDVAALRDALRRIGTDEALRQRLAAGARATYERGGFTEAAVIGSLGALYARARAARKGDGAHAGR